MKPIVTFIVPVYKIEEEYLRKCIDTLTEIKTKDVEILLIDDGSPDRCGVICDDLSRRDSRIRSYHKENGGVSNARNYGIRKATGEYITFIDADDWVDAEKMDNVLCSIKDTRYDMYIFGQYIEFKNMQPIQLRPFEKDRFFCEKEEINELQKMVFVRGYKTIRTDISSGIFANAVDKIVKKSVLVENNCFLDESMHLCEDGLLYLKAFEYCKTVQYKDLCVYHYRMRKNSACHTIDRMGYSDIAIFYRKAADVIKEYKKDISCYKALCYRCFDLILEHFDRAYLEVNINSKAMTKKIEMLVQEMKTEPFCTVLHTVKCKDYPMKNRIKLFLFKNNLSWIFLLVKHFKRKVGLTEDENYY